MSTSSLEAKLPSVRLHCCASPLKALGCSCCPTVTPWLSLPAGDPHLAGPLPLATLAVDPVGHLVTRPAARIRPAEVGAGPRAGAAAGRPDPQQAGVPARPPAVVASAAGRLGPLHQPPPRPAGPRGRQPQPAARAG